MKFPEGIAVYGNKMYREWCPSESIEQVTFFSELRRNYPETHGLLAIHPRNEGKRTYHQIARDKSEGLSTGASDIIIPGCPAFICELKRQDHTKCKLGDEQVKYLLAAKEAGCFVCIALGWVAAYEAFEEWIMGVENG